MSNAASFDLLKFVERRPTLSAGKILSMVILCAVVMMGYFLFQTDRLRHSTEVSSKLALTINQLRQTLQPHLQQGTNNPVMGVLPSGSLQGEQGFYPEFEALSHIAVAGLWLNDVVIHRHPAFIKMTGAMDDPDKLEQLLKQLALQPAFKNVQFIGVDVSKGLLPNVPEKYREEVKQLKIPAFYHFTIQTTLLNSSALKKSEALL